MKAEFNSWFELYLQVQRLVAETEVIYDTTKDPKDLEELDGWIEQNKDYLAVVMTQAKMLEDISEELDNLKMTEEQKSTNKEKDTKKEIKVTPYKKSDLYKTNSSLQLYIFPLNLP